MKRGYLLDTNILSYLVNGDSAAARKTLLRRQQDSETALLISSISEAELRYGMARRALSEPRREAIEGLLAHFEVLPWGRPEAQTYGEVRARLEAAGVTVSAMDLLIVAQALSVEAILVTADQIFLRISKVLPTLKIENWATDLPAAHKLK